MPGFKSNVQAIFEKHGIKDEKLQAAISDLFSDFETYMLRNKDLAKFVKETIDREEDMKSRFR